MMTAPALQGMMLSELLQGWVEVRPEQDCQILGITLDSREVKEGYLFLACRGSQKNGYSFIRDAIEHGAIAVLWEAVDDTAPLIDSTIPSWPVSGLSQLAGEIGARFYHYPSIHMKMIGITGTNGKTSCSQFLAQALSQHFPCAVIGTLGNGLYGSLSPASHTTPDAISTQALLAEFKQAGAEAVAMEVSSHGLHQGRVQGVGFDIAVFTNLSRDHLDYHGDMQAYAEAKKRLFEMPTLQHAVINSDDAYGEELLHSLPTAVDCVAYGVDLTRCLQQAKRYVCADRVELSEQGMRLHIVSSWGDGEIHSSLIGRFNVSNLLAVLAVLLLLEGSIDKALEQLTVIKAVKGRMQRLGGEGNPLVIVDYAHTPDALEQVLRALSEHQHRQLYCVFGCGGDRDKGKRPLMGKIAQQFADKVVLTDDNPRTESNQQIIADILQGMDQHQAVTIEHDRQRAISNTVLSAAEGDIILIAGKGHEDYQIVGDTRLPFSDAEVVKAALKQWRSE